MSELSDYFLNIEPEYDEEEDEEEDERDEEDAYDERDAYERMTDLEIRYNRDH